MRAARRAANVWLSDAIVAASHRFPYLLRLHRPQEFEEVLRSGRDGADRRSRRQGRGRWFAVTARPNGLGFHRVGIIAARRAIPLAVQRNRQKRIVREVFRTSLRPPPSLDVVVRVLREAGDAESRRAAREELEALLVGIAK